MNPMIKDLPTLFGKSKNSKIKVWTIRAVDYGSYSKVEVCHGYLNGQSQHTSTTVTSGKNLGKINQTTHFQQACMDAKSKWDKQILKGYRQTKEELGDLAFLPMLAQTYSMEKNVFPCTGQPKMNGVRCIATYDNGQCSYTSRNGKSYNTVSHLTKELQYLFGSDQVVLDGELYHPSLALQQIVSQVRREKSDRSIFDTSVPLQYWIYDLAILGVPFKERLEILSNYFAKFCNKGDSSNISLQHIVFVPTVRLYNQTTLSAYNDLLLDEGFEGVMLRLDSGLYIPSYRSRDLLKYKVKTFKEDDFVIIGGRSAVGKDEGTVIFECETANKLPFSVRPKGTFEQRADMYQNLNRYIGKHLVVKYAELTKDGVPFHVVGLYVREDVE